MPKFLNRNPHVVYVEYDGEMHKVGAYQTVEATGPLADRFADTPRLVDLGELTDDQRERIETEVGEERSVLFETFSGPAAFPAVDNDDAGDDDQPRKLEDLKVAELAGLAKENDVQVKASGSKAVKDDYVKALDAAGVQVGAGRDVNPSGPTEHPYAEYSTESLREALSFRGLDTTGSRDELADRLAEYQGHGGPITAQAAPTRTAPNKSSEPASEKPAAQESEGSPKSASFASVQAEQLAEDNKVLPMHIKKADRSGSDETITVADVQAVIAKREQSKKDS